MAAAGLRPNLPSTGASSCNLRKLSTPATRDDVTQLYARTANNSQQFDVSLQVPQAQRYQGKNRLANASFRSAHVPSSARINSKNVAAVGREGSSSTMLTSSTGVKQSLNVNKTDDFSQNNISIIGEEQVRKYQARKENLSCIMSFAFSLMQALNAINKQSFQNFKLRIGVHCGQVIGKFVCLA